MASLRKFASREVFPLPVRRKARPALFHGFWLDPESGRRLGRASRLELREAGRIYRRYHRRLGERAA